jgi:hypothetical protein
VQLENRGTKWAGAAIGMAETEEQTCGIISQFLEIFKEARHESLIFPARGLAITSSKTV